MRNQFDHMRTSEDLIQEHPGQQKFDNELEKLKAITLTGDLVQDVRKVAQAQDVTPPDLARMLEQGDKEGLRTNVQEWVEGIDRYLKGAGATDQLVKPLDENATHVKTRSERSGRFLQVF